MNKLLAVFLIIAIYLIITYAYFYDFLGQKKLVPPPHETKILVGTNPNNPSIKYAALGDSLTAGVGVDNYHDSYPYLVAQKLSSGQNVQLLNFSQSGATLKDVLTYQLPQTLSAEPDLITLLIGVNDIHNFKSSTEFEKNYTRIVKDLKKTNAKIYLLSIPYLGSSQITYFPYNLIWDFKTQQFNTVIKKISSDTNTAYIDLYYLTKPAGFYSADQFHPSDKGYKLWSDTINVN
ncbi:SGNH/GDSL hydrolase family protein [Candidatus Daviesbacteria bacterium]|nr:SGNH/GDSL hydrolase family protein [Candidatus Daviesbacteria bacterium]